MSKYLEYFAGPFDETVAEKMKPENKPYVAYSPVDGVAYTIVKVEEEDGIYYDVVIFSSIPTPTNINYQPVDLGLPSGNLWCDRNIGSVNVEDYGTYFAWGETEGVNFKYGTKRISEIELTRTIIYHTEHTPMEYLTDDVVSEFISQLKSTYGDNYLDLMYQQMVVGQGYKVIQNNEIDKFFNWNTYKHCNGSYDTITKYNNGDYLELEDDSVHVCMGGNWITPSIEDCRELINYTTVTPETINGVKGSRLTSNMNGNSIFIPFSGDIFDNIIDHTDNGGFLWFNRIYEEINMNTKKIAKFLIDEYSCTIYYIFGLYSDNTRSTGSNVRGIIPGSNRTNS